MRASEYDRGRIVAVDSKSHAGTATSALVWAFSLEEKLYVN